MAKPFSEAQKAQLDYSSFTCLRGDESVLGIRRIASLHREVERLERRLSLLQMRDAGLPSAEKDFEMRVNILEEKLMADAEVDNNEIHLR